jgi:hypothetical protein
VRRVKCFDEEAARLGAHTTLDAGPRVIEVARITGTVDKCGELDSRFRLIGRYDDRRERRRRGLMDRADLSRTILPPIDVYRLGGEFYVIDGNRRVAAAKRQKVVYMDAHVKECVSLSDGEARRGVVSRRKFEQETGLKNIELAFDSGYAVLLEDAASHQAPPTGDAHESARLWYSTWYLSGCRLLRESPLSRRFPEARKGDLFVMVSRFYREMMGGYPPGVSYQTLLSGFLFAKDLPGRRRGRILRLPPFRFLLFLLGGRRRR